MYSTDEWNAEQVETFLTLLEMVSRGKDTSAEIPSSVQGQREILRSLRGIGPEQPGLEVSYL